MPITHGLTRLGFARARNRALRHRAWPCVLAAVVACGQAKPREAAQTAHTEIEAAGPQLAPALEPTDRDAEAPAAAALSSARSCASGETPSALAQAAFAGDIEQARVLVVAEEQDASVRSGCNATALMMAIAPYSEEPGTPPKEQRTRRLGKLDAAGLLLARCFDIAGSDEQGMSALHVAVSAPDNDRIVTRLMQRMVECGVGPDPKTKAGVTPLMLAVQAKRTGLVRWLVEAGADVNARSEAGDSPIGLAEASRNRELLAILRKAAGLVKR